VAASKQMTRQVNVKYLAYAESVFLTKISPHRVPLPTAAAAAADTHLESATWMVPPRRRPRDSA